jgi:hypothetical protein
VLRRCSWRSCASAHASVASRTLARSTRSQTLFRLASYRARIHSGLHGLQAPCCHPWSRSPKYLLRYSTRLALRRCTGSPVRHAKRSLSLIPQQVAPPAVWMGTASLLDSCQLPNPETDLKMPMLPCGLVRQKTPCRVSQPTWPATGPHYESFCSHWAPKSARAFNRRCGLVGTVDAEA